ncbi:MarR family winged helix-turn-helix transcriptional regulator [Paenibacillus thermoaerophilus]|uniref:MarR family winged helix-turn-helix transcriptional regulator n=1 Tax=Paenibacillus thermoaerophilus TaxID=1215385 RepID=A0ABW2V297_9BACL|nr:MarR family transcriptional regulator [Paenibacillus thermoaerophilus]TMV07392.1 MarR family transcriptional regulator [Paenibacillus thermoaerophilus]
MVAHEFLRLWTKVSKDLKQHMENSLAPTLTEGQLNVLELLMSREGPCKPSDLLEHLETTPAAVTTLLDRMEKNGLIERSRDNADRRIVWVSVTPFGIEEWKRGTAIRDRFLDEYLNRLSAHNQQVLIYLLGKVAQAS